MTTPRDDETTPARTGTGSTLMQAVAGLSALLRSLHVEELLAAFGFVRRRRQLAPAALFGAGVAVGTAVGLLVTPRSERETRRLPAPSSDTEDVTQEARAMITLRDDETTAAHVGMGPAMRAVEGLSALLRSLHFEETWAPFGFLRRRSPLVSVALFGAGVAVGAAVGLLVTPRSGGETRRRLRRRFNELRKRTDHALLKAEYEIEEKTGELSGKVEARARAIERKLGDEIEVAAEVVKASLEQARAAVQGEGGSGAKDEQEGAGRRHRQA